MERREVIRSLMFTSLGVTLRMPINDVWHRATNYPVADQEFAALTEAILPATDTPGAIEAGVPNFILTAIHKTNDPTYPEMFESGWEAFKTACLLKYNMAFHVLSSEQQIVFLKTLADADDQFFNVTRTWTIVGYFTSEVGMTQALEYNPIPGKYWPCEPVNPETRGEATYF